MTDESELRRVGTWVHHVLLALLVALRPLIWDGDSGSIPALAWYGLSLVGLTLVAGEVACGARLGWRWGWSGIAALALTLLLLPAALRSPLGFAGLAQWGMVAGHLAFASYLMQVVPGRERLALGALLAGLAGETCFALGQQRWSLPDLAKGLQEGKFAGQVAAEQIGDYAERIANGGVYGSFTLSNTLAGFLLLTVPLAAAAFRPGPALARAAVAGLGIAGLGVLLALTSSKGGIAALAAAVALVALTTVRGGWRWCLPLAAVALMAVALALPRVRAGLAASAGVRLGYWDAAITLIGERPLAGHGLGGFATEAARALPIGAEYSRQVHDEPLDAAVDAGVAAGLALLALLALLARTPTPGEHAPDRRRGLAGLALILAVPYLHVFGMLSFAGWPGAPFDLHLGWSLLVGAVMAATVWIAALLPPPPGWALRLALVAAGLHALIDFDLHSGGVVGTLVTVAVLAGSGNARTLRFNRPLRAVPALAAATAVAVLIWGGHRGRELAQARVLVAAVREIQVARHVDAERVQLTASALAGLLDREQPAGAVGYTKADVDALAEAAIGRAWSLACPTPAAEAGDLVRILDLVRPGRGRLPRTTRAVGLHPHDPELSLRLAGDLAATGAWREAIACARSALARSPWHLPYRQELARLLEHGAAATADPALLAQAVAERERIAALAPRVHPRDRARAEP